MTQATAALQVDVRAILPRDRHPTIFLTFRRLAPNEAMELVNDHDPKPLYYQFQSELPGQLAWEYLERGPETWRVRITKRAPPDDHGPCCGSCGGQ